MLLFDAIKSELEDKIRRLEEDRNNIDISSGKDILDQKRNAENKIFKPLHTNFICYLWFTIDNCGTPKE